MTPVGKSKSLARLSDCLQFHDFRAFGKLGDTLCSWGKSSEAQAMVVKSYYREGGRDAQLFPHPRTLVPRHVRIILVVDDFLTRLAFTVVRIGQTIRRSRID